MPRAARSRLPEPRLAVGFAIEDSVVKSARRTLELFEYFAERQEAASVSDVVAALRYPQSSASALLKSLAALGYLEYDRKTRLYVPTLRIALLGGWIHDSFFRDGDLLDLVQALSNRVNDTVILGLQNGIHAQYVLMLDPHRPVRVHARTGSLRPLFRSAIGRMLLTTKTEKEIAGLLRRANAKEPLPAHRLAERDVLAEIALCRRQGYAVSEGLVTPGRAVVAVLLPTSPGHAPVALGIGGAVARIRRSRLRLLRIMREGIERTYGELGAA
jgi:DNA-binding IclR family transcriptional regulator